MTTILVVEDEETVLKMLAFNLEEEGYTVLTAMDGEQALQIIRKKKPDLIILDILLPLLDGLRRDPLHAKPQYYVLFQI